MASCPDSHCLIACGDVAEGTAAGVAIGDTPSNNPASPSKRRLLTTTPLVREKVKRF
jgi:hypothetical protein